MTTNSDVNSILGTGGPPDQGSHRRFRDACLGVDISAQLSREATRIGMRITRDSSSMMIFSDLGFSDF